MAAKIWISKKNLNKLTMEANKKFPYETGGVLMGYRSKEGDDIVIKYVIGPGYDAIHKKLKFIPDNEYHKDKIEKHYTQSKRIHTYLGDWHTHPSGKGSFSRIDKKTLIRIARYAGARVPTPIMLLLTGNIDSWGFKAVCLSKKSFVGIYSCYKLLDLQICRF